MILNNCYDKNGNTLEKNFQPNSLPDLQELLTKVSNTKTNVV